MLETFNLCNLGYLWCSYRCFCGQFWTEELFVEYEIPGASGSWGVVTHTCVGNLVIGLGASLWFFQKQTQAATWINAYLSSVRPPEAHSVVLLLEFFFIFTYLTLHTPPCHNGLKINDILWTHSTHTGKMSAGEIRYHFATHSCQNAHVDITCLNIWAYQATSFLYSLSYRLFYF